MNPLDPLVTILVGLVAGLYSSVGHGGASGYLAVLAFTTMPTKQAAVLALVMNVFVASVSYLAFNRAKHFEWRLVWPFMIGSIPFAILGGSLKVSDKVYSALLALALGAAALRIIWVPKDHNEVEVKKISLPIGIGTGAGIGLLSGMVGVGGGVFLSPVMILMKWADAKKTAAVAALFIVVNSLAGLSARPLSAVMKTMDHWPLVAVGIAGALAGSAVGANFVPNPWLRRTLGFVLMIAVVKLAFK